MKQYKKGDFIGQKYEVYGVLGEGGFGIVYLVYSQEMESVYALKTFRDEYLEDVTTRERFKKEAQVWIELERHPYLVRAHFVEKISERIYIAMEHIASDEQGLNTLDGYLRRSPPDLAQSLRWAIQFCHGMEHAYSKGIKAHRDIKPANIMIDQSKTVKITDFGLAGVIGEAKAISGIKLGIQQNKVGFSCQTMEGVGFGTPTHMPPEQFINAAGCDERSDIYSFGVVLYQMASGGKLPFLATLPRNDEYEESRRFWVEMYKLHGQTPIPKINTPLSSIIVCCLEKKPISRYFSFKALRRDLEALLKKQAKEVVTVPELKEFETWELINKGYSLATLRKDEEALLCFEKVLEINQKDAKAWYNKGAVLERNGNEVDAITCFDQAIAIEKKYAGAWNGKGNALKKLGKKQHALTCYDQAIKINPLYAIAWHNKGILLKELKKFDEALNCLVKALEINPQDFGAWNSKGLALYELRNFYKAISCFDRAIEINPREPSGWNNKGITFDALREFNMAIENYDKAIELAPEFERAWYNKGFSLYNLKNLPDALICFKKALEINPLLKEAWHNKGIVLKELGHLKEAIKNYDNALEIFPDDAEICIEKGVFLHELGMHQQAVDCCDKALEINQVHAKAWYIKGVILQKQINLKDAITCYSEAIEINPIYLEAWHNKAIIEDEIGRGEDAAFSYKRFIELAPTQYAKQVEYARQRLREMEKR